MRRRILYLEIAILLFAILPASAGDFQRQVNKIMERPQFAHAIWGIEFYSLDHQKPVYTRNENVFFVPGSTTKLITAGSALNLFGADYRFHTRIYATGDINHDGVLQGDLILVASGDPNLSGRIQSDGSLAFENEDHSYGGEDSHGVQGDPLAVIRNLARQVSAHHIKRINGRVIVDASLFVQGERELGTDVVIAPIVVNDNLVDILITPGAAENDPATLIVSPQTSYARILNEVKTGKTGSESDFHMSPDIENSDGTRTVTVGGTIPLHGKTEMNSFAVDDPTRYAEIVLTEALREMGISANPRLKEDKPDFKTLAALYTEQHQVAEHVSPPLTEEIKVLLKVSQNLHASMMPYLFSSLIAKKDAPQSGFDLMHDFLSKGSLDLSGASQSDGAGGSAHFTPAFMVSYLKWMSSNRSFEAFRNALPILGRDGTLFQIQVNSKAAGHVFAKTGTYGASDYLNHDVMVTGKGLAGYTTTANGHHLAFAIYVNNVRVPSQPNAIRDIVGQALGEIAATAYESL
jgi:PBP4 family serine-type D-alanyl-D-alanine carboxypeptidase